MEDVADIGGILSAEVGAWQPDRPEAFQRTEWKFEGDKTFTAQAWEQGPILKEAPSSVGVKSFRPVAWRMSEHSGK